MKKIRVCVHGLGNIGKYVIEAVEFAKDMECVGVVRRKESIGSKTFDLRGNTEFDSVESLIAKAGKPDVCLICTPSRHALDDDKLYLSQGISTVDSFDIHGEICSLVEKLDKKAKDNKAIAIVSAGWDPPSLGLKLA